MPTDHLNQLSRAQLEGQNRSHRKERAKLKAKLAAAEAQLVELRCRVLPGCTCTSNAVPGLNHNPQCPRWTDAD